VRVPAALVAALAVSIALAGCAGGPRGGDGFTGTCPSWIKGLSTNVYKEAFQNSSVPDQKFNPSMPTGAGLERFQDRPLDFVELDFHPEKSGRPQGIGLANATLELRAFRSDRNDGVSDQLLIQHGRTGEERDVWSWGPGVHANFTLKVPLAAPDQPPDTAPIVLRWDFVPDTSARTPSEAVMFYTAYFWYRTCGADGQPARA
jgi:hypothetical protein